MKNEVQIMSKKAERNFFIIVGIILCALVLLFVFDWREPKEDLNDGESAYDFCFNKCGDKDVYSSTNSTKYDFIRCDCVVGVRRGDGKYSKDYPIYDKIYFDSDSEIEITREVVGERISNT